MRIKLLLYAFHEHCGIGPAAPNDMGRETFQRRFEHHQTAAMLYHGRPQLADEQLAHVGMRESAETRNDYTAARMGLDRTFRIRRQ